MRLTIFGGAALAVLLLVSLPVNASSFGLSGSGLSGKYSDQSPASSLLIIRSVPLAHGETGNSAGAASTGKAGGFQFGSAMAGNASTFTEIAVPYSTGKQVGLRSAGSGSRGLVSTRCEVPGPVADPPSMVPEPSSVVLLGLGLATLAFSGRLRGWILNPRGLSS